MENLYNIDTLELANVLYNLSCDLDSIDYIETKENEINEIENALNDLKNYAILNPSANKNYLTLLCCLDRIASAN